MVEWPISIVAVCNPSMRAPNADESAVSAKEHDSKDRHKRDRDILPMKPSKSLVTEEPPPKTRKTVPAIVGDEDENRIPEDDPVAFARRALAMFRKEVEADGDFEEPDTTPGQTDLQIGMPVVGGNKMTTPSPKASQGVSKSNGRSLTDDSSSSRWEKAGRRPMISQEDDPSIL